MNAGTGDALSDLSDHSSDELILPHSTLTPSQLPPPSLSHDQASEDDWSDITPSEADEADSNAITLNTLTASASAAIPNPSTSTMTITIESFTLEEDSSTTVLHETDSRVANVFVEYQFLNFDFGELETPSSLPKPAPGESIHFNFEKGKTKQPLYNCTVTVHVIILLITVFPGL